MAPRKGMAVEQLPDDVQEFELDDDVDIIDPDAPSGDIVQLDDGQSDFGPEPAAVINRLDPNPPQDLSTTHNIQDERTLADFQLEDADEVEIRPITVDDVPVRTYTVRTNIDVGPVFYGVDNEIHLKKGVLYRVPEPIFHYLRERALIWSLA